MAADNPSSPRNPSRRAFLHASGNVLGGSWLAIQLPGLLAVAQAASAAIEQGAPLRNLDPAEAAALEAIAARIIPSDDTPGAREAGVIHFIDQALGGFLAEASAELRAGIESVDGLAAAAVDGGRFAELGPEDQDAILHGIEETPFFELMHYLTVAGMFALPAHGGNRDHLGWKLLGFDHRHGWAPPFGHYDAEQMGAPQPALAHGTGHEHD